MPVPSEHIEQAQLLSPDAEIEFFELTPAGSTGKIYFKNDNTMSWMGNEYTGLPLSFTGETFNAEGSAVQPQLVIGQPDVDISMFKGLIWDGTLDNARIDRHKVLLTHALNNQNIKHTLTYRVKRIDNYSASQITMALATFSVAGPTKLPFRLYIPPAFPFVRLG